MVTAPPDAPPDAPHAAWLPPPEHLALDADDVHVWRASRVVEEAALGALRATLSPDERQRADRFHFQRDRRDYVSARGMLRDILGRYLDVRPEHVRFAYSSHGKPSPSADMDAGWLHFNVSHSRGIALCAVARGRDVGVDIEHIREDIESAEIAARFFSRDEQSALARLPSGRRLAAFFDCWTRKEAFIKALGDGLSHPLESFTVSLAPGRSALVHRTDGSGTPARWSLVALAPGHGFAGALAMSGAVRAVHCWQWEERQASCARAT